MNGLPGELVTCLKCGSRNWEIRFGPQDGTTQPTVTCSGCEAMYWLEAYPVDPGQPDRWLLQIRMKPVNEVWHASVPDHP